MAPVPYHPTRVTPSFFCSATPTPALYTLSLHDALPIFAWAETESALLGADSLAERGKPSDRIGEQVGRLSSFRRSEEHTSELQSRGHLVCRLLLEKKKRRPTAGPLVVQLAVSSPLHARL